MLTFENVGVVDATHRLVVQVPDLVPPGRHHVMVMMDRETTACVVNPEQLSGETHPTPTERAADFLRWVGTLRPAPVPAEVGALFSRESIYD